MMEPPHHGCQPADRELPWKAHAAAELRCPISFEQEVSVHILWMIIIGFIAGVIAKFITPGDNEPSGFILTTILGIVGAFLATYLGQALGWYRADQSAGLIGAVVGAIIILVVWGFIAGRRRSSF
jgi:uncharacterized membrane protein YeaQ/YmgE (transglycosylase-associated protein family)